MVMVASSTQSKTNKSREGIAVGGRLAFFFLGVVFGLLHSNFAPDGSSRDLTSIQKQQVAPITTDPESTEKTKNEVGWKNIQVFYGQVQDAPQKDRQWYSQVGQDKLVFGLLRNKRDGYFIDLAANDALPLSNTYGLERFHGWKGLCIEPNPKYFFNHARYRTCQLVAAIVGEVRMEEIKFNYARDEGGGISKPGMDNGPETKWAKDAIPAYTVPLKEILERVDAPHVIDYLSLDVEGAEYLIMKGFPLDSYQIRIMTVERPTDELKAHLNAHGYEFVGKLSVWGETLWVHKDVKESLDLSVIPPRLRVQSNNKRY